MKDKWRNYALKSGKIEKSYITKHCNRNKFGKKQKEEIDCAIMQYGTVVVLSEPVMPLEPFSEFEALEMHEKALKKVRKKSKKAK
jgi:hypothetical protein